MKRAALVISIVAAAVITLFILRSLYARALLESFAGNLRQNGWGTAGDRYIMQPKEMVTFEASYLFIKLGTVRFEILGRTECNGVPSYRLRAFIDSYSGIPFVDYHAVYETCADARTMMCLSTSNDKEKGDKWVRSKYILDYPVKRLIWEESADGVLLKKVEMPIDTVYTDGLSFFYYVREACRASDGRKEKLAIPIVSDTIRSSVYLTINERREPCSVSAFHYPIQANRLSGHIDFEGTFGVTGAFVGWISADSAAVPLKADLKVIVGSIVVKLKSISRDRWIPPRAE